MALIICPECGKEYSSYATQCPNCAFPTSLINEVGISIPQAKSRVNKANIKPKSKHMKLPNGYGRICKLSGKRRNPYAVYPSVSVKQYSDDGKRPNQKALGYYPTYTKAYEALAYYNASHGATTSSCMIFSQVFDKMIEELKNDTSEKKKSSSTINGYIASYKRCEILYNVPMDKIFKEQMQSILDNCDKGYSTHMSIKKMFNATFKYAIENGIIEKNYAKYVHVKKKNDNEHGDIFTEDEIKILWENKTDKTVQTALILLYSGLRISELKETTINIQDKLFEGGIKTTAGKERIIPFHDSIIKFVDDFNQEEYIPRDYRMKEFYPMLERLGLAYSINGKKHTPHDLRHTFSWLADSYKMDQVAKYFMMGHQFSDDVDKGVYGHRTTDQLREEINKLPTW